VGHPDLARRIHVLRLEQEVSQEALTRATGVSTRQYQRIENGTADPRLSTLYHIAALLGTTGSELILGLDPPPDDPETDP
jgi:transcriptional regulator with XRE-family HTH domain